MLSTRLRHVSFSIFITVVRKAVMRTIGIAAPEFAAPPPCEPAVVSAWDGEELRACWRLRREKATRKLAIELPG